MTASWCAPEDIAQASGRLLDRVIALDFEALARRATEYVRNDICTHVDLAAIDALPAPPPQLAHLAAIKGQELAWAAYYGKAAKDQYELTSAGQNYNRRLDALLKDIRAGLIDRCLKKPAEGIAPEHEAIGFI